MTTPTTRRPLPAVIFLVALLGLTALVWWRVASRDDSENSGSAAPSCTASDGESYTVLPKQSLVRITVYNSTDRNGLGANVAGALKSRGFKVPAAAANDPSGKVIDGIAEVRFGPAGEAGAKLVSYYLSGAKMVSTDSTEATVVVSIGKKFKAMATNETVNAALKRDGITLANGSTAAEASSSC